MEFSHFEAPEQPGMEHEWANKAVAKNVFS